MKVVRLITSMSRTARSHTQSINWWNVYLMKKLLDVILSIKYTQKLWKTSVSPWIQIFYWTLKTTLFGHLRCRMIKQVSHKTSPCQTHKGHHTICWYRLLSSWMQNYSELQQSLQPLPLNICNVYKVINKKLFVLYDIWNYMIVWTLNGN